MSKQQTNTETGTEIYTSFAQVYDQLMDNIPYEEWHTYLSALLQEYGVKANDVVLELGCGTGNMTRRLEQDGYRMIGLDISEDMLSLAQKQLVDQIVHTMDETALSVSDCVKESEDTDIYNKDEDSLPGRPNIIYIQQDMTKFSLNGYVDAIVSICDSMNYLTDPEDFYQTLLCVKEYLKDDGVFIFDLKTEYFYKEICGDHVFAEDRDEVSFIWDNCYDESIKVNEYALSIFVPEVNHQNTTDASSEDVRLSANEAGEHGLWRKFTEFHYQRAYDVKEVKDIVADAGLQLVHIYDAFTKKKPNRKSERIYCIVQKR